MNTDKNSSPRLTAAICITAVAVCSAMAAVYAFCDIPYFLRSLVKAALFVPPVLFFGIRFPQLRLRSALTPRRGSLLFSLAAGGAVFAVITGAYFMLKNAVDLSAVTGALTDNLGVDRELYPFVAIYIPVVNAFLEELFFRAFLYIALGRLIGEKRAFLFSAILFTLYHGAMLIGWGDILLFALIMTGIFAGGVVFNLLDRKSECLYPSYFTHMFANLAINFIGFILFGFI